MRNLTFDRAGIDKLVCHDGFRQTYNDGGNTISSVVQFYSLHSNHQKLFKVVKVLSPLRYESGEPSGLQ